MEDKERSYPYDLVDEDDMRRIKRRAMRLVERMHSATGMYHLSEENRARLTTEHETDEIAAALHDEMPWMSPATEAL
ncbi:MAG: hypothetical protein P8Q92_07795 [Pseudoprimorskyibacter sp.]|nr:hypothetical protein [Pseudoprimorskyibacter sp.]